jgi:tetratricopeptide (TPR) repeat protein
MRRIIIVTIPVFFLCLSVYSQKQYDFATIDAKTYEHFYYGKWDSVIYYGKLALENNIDYFYLRLRIGESYYYKQNYQAAISHFEKAAKFNSSDTTTKAFLYFSYLFSGRENDSRLVEYTPSSQTNNVKHKNISLNSVYFETGPGLNSNIKKNKNIDPNRNDNILGNAYIAGNIYYNHLGLNFFLGKRISVYAGMSFLNEQNLSLIQMSEHRLGGRYFHVRDTVVNHPGPPPFTSYDTIYENRQIINSIDSTWRFVNNLKQIDYYLKANLHIAKGLDFVPFFHLLSVRTTIFKVSNKPLNFYSKDTITLHTQIPHPPMMTPFDTVIYQYQNNLTPIDRYDFHEIDTSYSNFSFGLSVNKNWGKISTSLFAAFSNLNNKKQNQTGVSLTWYPKGNLNLYFSSTLTAFSENKIRSTVFNQLAGFKTYKNIWLESFVTLGKLNDFTEDNGFIVNNSPGTITFRFGLSPTIILKHIDISIHYQFQTEEEKYTTRISNSDIVQNYKYVNHLIIGGIKWKI